MKVYRPKDILKNAVIVLAVLAAAGVLFFVSFLEYRKLHFYPSPDKKKWYPAIPSNPNDYQQLDYFEKSLSHLQRIEGMYCNDPLDKGKETYCGVTKRYYPDWDGWKILDCDISPENKQTIMSVLTYRLYKNMWDANNFGAISDSTKAKYLFEFYVHTPHKFYNVINHFSKGKSGWKTGIDSISARYINTSLSMEDVRKERIAHFFQIIENDSSQTRFIRGWVNRTKK